MPIEPGDTVPPATLKQMTPDGIKDVDLRILLSGKKVILFGLPGAYTPVCSTAHLPGFIAEADRLKNEGVAEIACIAVNDPFVMSAWEKEKGATGKVLMLCDPDHRSRAAFVCRSIFRRSASERLERYSMIVQDGVCGHDQRGKKHL